MAKLLRLDVAQLTDVGRKRDHNEDNMAYVIPKDPQVMTQKGALFIVADGMGGHAAGEVASEIAVDTVSNAYYQDDNDDVPTSLLQAIRRANAAIHQRAAENMLRSGMGTTCVVAILRGNVAYIANVGDSRAYLVRRSQIRQISQDHSWVAEQVRAGLLTEEQARTHAQRNVITRSLGTQPEVEIDLFREVLEEGDSLILCSDGLSGLVNDDELQRTIEQFMPQESVYHLIERANENGGPDNITAIVARVQELGVEPPGVRQPVPIGGPEVSNEDTARLFAPVGAGASMTAHGGESPLPGSPFSYTISSPLASSESDTAPQPVLKGKKRRGRLFAPTIALLVLFILVAAGSGLYYFIHVNQSQTINQTLTNATQLISRASTETNSNPAQALQDLSQAQQGLLNLQKNYTLSSSASSQLTSLQNQLVNETKTAITNYNQNAHITLLPCTTSTPTSLSQNIAQTLAFVQTSTSVIYYALGQDGKIYQMIQSNGTNQYNLSNAFSPAGANTQIAAIASAKKAIFALTQQMANNTPGNFAIDLLTPGQNAQLQSTHSQNIDSTLTKNGQAPDLIAAWDSGSNTNIYVVLASSSSANSATILSYSVDNKGNFGKASSVQISVNEPIMSIAASEGQLYMLLKDGSVWSTPINGTTVSSTPAAVLVDAPIPPTLAATAQGFKTDTIVPTVTPTAQKGKTGLSISPLPQSNRAVLSSGMAMDANGTLQFHLFIGDPGSHRVLDLTFPQPLATASGPGATPTTTATSTTQGNSVTLSLHQQYVSPTYFNTVKDVTIDPGTTTPGGTTIDILGQSASNSESLTFISSQKACAS